MVLTNQRSAVASRGLAWGKEPADASLPAILSPSILPCATPSLIAPIVDYEGDDYSVAIDIDSVPPSQLCMPSPRHGAFPVAVELGPDSSTSSNDGAPSMLLHTVPLPFIDAAEASSLSTSINSFRLDDRTTKYIAAFNRIPSHYNQGGIFDARIFSAGPGRESCWMRAANVSGIP